MFVDSHCHLDYPGLVEEEAEVVARAERAGVGLMQTIATRLDRAPGALELARRHASVVAAVGVHPHEAGGHGVAGPEPLLAFVADPKVTAIGETGLDYHYDNSPRDAQARSFRAHIAACRASGLPLIVHTRDADADTAAILADEMGRGPFTGVIHCYSSSRALAERAVALGLYLGIGGIATFKRSQELRATLKEMPRERLLLETDAPYLAPPPHRGKRNEPAYLPRIAEVLADTLGETLAAVEAMTTENFFRLFAKARTVAP
ncbi:MAG: TatD family hydrolase [Alphaproteobacteria bacterium]